MVTTLINKRPIDHHQFFLAQTLFSEIASNSLALDHFIKEVILTKFVRGESIYRQGDSSVEIYLIREGEVHLRQQMGDGNSRLIGKHGRGSLFGQVSFMNSGSHTTTANVELDSRVYCIPGKSLLKLMNAEPSVSRELARLVSYRLHRVVNKDYEYEYPASVYTIFYPENARRCSEISSVLASAMVTENPGPVLLLSLSKASIYSENYEPMLQSVLEKWPTIDFGEILFKTQRAELNFDLMLANEIHDTKFNSAAAAKIIPALLGRLKKYYASIIVDAGRHFEDPVLTKVLTQSDKILLIRNPTRATNFNLRWKAVAEYCSRQIKDFSDRVVTISDEQSGESNNSEYIWQSVNPFTSSHCSHFRVPSISSEMPAALKEKPFVSGLQRLARSLSGTSRGICFGGGGARSFAHVGVIDILQQEGLDFDAVVGSSMGAVIAAAYARGHDASQISAILKDVIPDSKSILDKHLPLVSFYKGIKLEQALRKAFGDLRFDELEIPFYCNGCDLESGRQLVFEEGYIATALRASVSLPGVYPPYRLGNFRIVDGGVINNLPGSILRDKKFKRILGISVSPLEDRTVIQSGVEHRPGNWLDKIRDYFSVPPILKIINRSIAIQGSELIKLRQDDFNYIFYPDVAPFDLFDFHRREEIIDCGRRSAMENLDQIKEQLSRPQMNHQ